MLKTLYVKDYALIDSMTVEFGMGLNIITGETGAGKSILIDALGLLLGERANSEIVRKGSQKAIVEGIFDVTLNKKIRALCDTNNLDNNDELILRREILTKGSSRCFINDSPVTLSLLASFGDLLVDIHGQHEHQSLLRDETHIEFLDEFAGVEKQLADYQAVYHKLNSIRYELKTITAKQNELQQRKDLYSFQLKEIDAVEPIENEDESITQDLRIMENAEKILELTSSAYDMLYEQEVSVQVLLSSVRQDITSLEKFDPAFTQTLEELNSAVAFINDIADSLRSYKANIDIEPAKLESLRERLMALNSLKRKYGGSIQAVLELRESLSENLSLAENFDEKVDKLKKEIGSLQIEAGKAAQILSIKRSESAKRVIKEIISVLQELGIPNAKFDVRFDKSVIGKNEDDGVIVGKEHLKAADNGYDKVEFFISTNAGEDVKPLIKVASGGEVSRIMLSLKTILAKNDKLPLLIFDEIDTGVSGKIAQKVGNALHGLAKFHQVIAITHLPQIASQADRHYVVEKTDTDGRTISRIRKLPEDEQVREVAKLMSGEKITDAALQSAAEMIASKKK
jgi:DNA repair protein RecN (Recombination protein N)